MNIPTKKTLEPKEFNGVAPEDLREAIYNSSKGCHRAFNVIYNALYEPMVWYFIGIKKVEQELAKDLTNEILAKVWEKASMYDSSKAHVTTWVYCIADFHFIDYKRREQTKKDYFAVYRLIETEYQFIPSEIHISGRMANPEQIMIQNETAEYLNKVFTEKVLGKALVKIMELRYVKELSLKEIAKKLNMNDSTLRVNLKRGRERVQDFINSNYEFASQLSLISKFAS